jgi:hypothetical protein
MELGIKGHKTRSHEVIDLLKMLGGINRYKIIGGDDKYFYYIRKKYKDIENSYIGPDEIKGYEIFSLEDFLEKFPYKVGDKVEVLITEDCLRVDCSGGRSHIEVVEITSMRWDPTRCEIAYRLKDITGEFYKNDIKGKVDDDEEQQIDPTIDYVELVNKTYEEEVGKMCAEITMDILYKNGITFEYLKDSGYDLPEGHHFVDENGNVIDAKKILLVKNSPSYPKTYEECCDILKTTHVEWFGYYGEVLVPFQILIICRDAYWKIAGEHMGLDEPWKPDFSDDSPKYNIFNYENEITLSDNNWSNRILAFPTLEMRNAFHENFKDLIEQCKELL